MKPMKPMKLGLASFLLAVPLLALFALLVPQAASAEPVSPAWSSEGGVPSFKVTWGPKPDDYSFPDGITRGVGIAGSIVPPLADGVTATLSAAKAMKCGDGGNEERDLSGDCLMGGGNGGSFTGYVKTGVLPNDTTCLTRTCGQVKLTYTIVGGAHDGAEVCVTIANPDKTGVAMLDPQVFGIVPGQDLFVEVRVFGNNGQLNTTFDGTLRVIPGSLLGSGVLIDGASGMTTVEVVEGIGLMRVSCVNAVPGDVLTFDILGGGRLSPCRSSLNVY